MEKPVAASRVALKLRTHGLSWSQLLDTLYWYAPNATEIIVCSEGEPTLEPRLSALLANCKMFNRHAKTIIYSDMSRYDVKVWKEIIRFNTLDELYVPFCDTAKARSNVRKLNRLMLRMHWRKPRIYVDSSEDKPWKKRGTAISVTNP